MKDAKLREQRAEWRTRRLGLNDARQQLWVAEKEQLKQEMESFSESDRLPPQHSPSDNIIQDHVITPDTTPTTHPSTDHTTNEPASPILSEKDKKVKQLEQPVAVPDEPHPQSVESQQDTVTVLHDKNVHSQELHVSMEAANTSKPHVSDSVVHQVLHPTSSDVVTEEFSKHLSPRQQLRRGRAPASTIQDIMYPNNSPAPKYHSTRGKPPPTTIQNLLHHQYQQQPGNT